MGVKKGVHGGKHIDIPLARPHAQLCGSRACASTGRASEDAKKTFLKQACSPSRTVGVSGA